MLNIFSDWSTWTDYIVLFQNGICVLCLLGDGWLDFWTCVESFASHFVKQNRTSFENFLVCIFNVRIYASLNWHIPARLRLVNINTFQFLLHIVFFWTEFGYAISLHAHEHAIHIDHVFGLHPEKQIIKKHDCSCH